MSRRRTTPGTTSVATDALPLADQPEPEKTVACPFKIIVDTREQRPYTFDRLYDGPAGRSPRIIVETERFGLPMGDYMALGAPRFVVERKSKEDLYGSISQRRENFEARLQRFASDLDVACVVVEAEWFELLNHPPAFSQFSPKALARTIQAWIVRYPMTQWVFVKDREWGEAFTFRLIERYWIETFGKGSRTP
jgi:ERCC4-type nuclease